MDTVTRSLPGPYAFTLDITHSVGDYHIVTTEDTSHNFLMSFFLSDITVTDGSTVPARTDALNATVNMTYSHMPLLMTATASMTLYADVNVDFMTCLNMHFLCLYIFGFNASYVESNAVDNVYCIDFDLNKICDPGEEAFSFTKS